MGVSEKLGMPQHGRFTGDMIFRNADGTRGTLFSDRPILYTLWLFNIAMENHHF